MYFLRNKFCSLLIRVASIKLKLLNATLFRKEHNLLHKKILKTNNVYESYNFCKFRCPCRTFSLER